MITLPLITFGVSRLYTTRRAIANPVDPPPKPQIPVKDSARVERPKVTNDMVVHVEALIGNLPYFTGRAKDFALQIIPTDGSQSKHPTITKDNLQDLPIEDFSVDGARIGPNSNQVIIVKFDEIHAPEMEAGAVSDFQIAKSNEKEIILTVGDARLRLMGARLNVYEHHMNLEGGCVLRRTMIRAKSGSRTN
jgi:hypothetical protein